MNKQLNVNDFVVIEKPDGIVIREFIVNIDMYTESYLTDNYTIDMRGRVLPREEQKDGYKGYKLLEIWIREDETTYKKIYDMLNKENCPDDVNQEDKIENQEDDTLIYLKEYIEHRLEIDRTILSSITNPLLFIKKLGTLDTLYDIINILSGNRKLNK